MSDIEERKAQAVQQALKGLEVEYLNHTGGLTPNMARVNGYSIVWHEFSYGANDPETVEIRLHDGDCVRIDIGDLRKQVET